MQTNKIQIMNSEISSLKNMNEKLIIENENNSNLKEQINNLNKIV